MLTRLYINNFITIEEIDVNFSKGFTSITGETGSGNRNSDPCRGQ